MAEWHREKAIELLDDSYEALIEYASRDGIEPVPDGGHQIDNHHPEEIYFWYNPAADMIIQEELEPYRISGIFETEDDADRFIRSYAERYGLDDLAHLEKYRAELRYQGQGPVLEDTDTEGSDPNRSEQIDFSDFNS